MKKILHGNLVIKDSEWLVGSADGQFEIWDGVNIDKPRVKIDKYGQVEFRGLGAAPTFSFINKRGIDPEYVYAEFNTDSGNGYFNLSDVSGDIQVQLSTTTFSKMLGADFQGHQIKNIKTILLNSQALLGTPIAGTLEYDGTDLWMTNDSVVRIKIGSTDISGKVDKVTGKGIVNLHYIKLGFTALSPELSFTLSDWQTLLDNTEFTEVVVDGTFVYLYGDTSLIIPTEAFLNNTNLEILGGTINVTVGVSSFEGCTNLVDVGFDDLVYIASYGFKNCTSLISIRLDRITYISLYAFQNTALITLVIADTLTDLGSSAGDNSVFSGVTTLENITIANYFKTNNSGNPDGDLVYALANNTVLNANGITYVLSTDDKLDLKVDKSNVVTNFSTLNDTTVPSTQAVETRISQTISNVAQFFLFKTSSDIGGYYKMLTDPSTGSVQTINGSGLSGIHTIASFVTESTVPNKLFLPMGFVKLHIHAKRTGGGTTVLYGEVYKRTSGGVETLIGTTTSTTALTTGDVDYELEFYNSTAIALLTTDRFVVKVIENTTSGTPTNTISIEDSNFCRLEMPISLASSSSGTASSTIDVTQTTHGFSVGNAIYLTGNNTYAKSKADTDTTAEFAGYVTTVTDANTFTYTIPGGVITTGVPNQVGGTVMYLSTATAGAVTSTDPAPAGVVGTVSKPVLYILEASVKAIVLNMRGMLIASAYNDIKFDYSGATDYCGYAPTGSATSASVWTITKVVNNDNGTVTTTTAINVKWDDRLTATYS